MIQSLYTKEDLHTERLRLLKKALGEGLSTREEEDVLDVLERRWQKEINRGFLGVVTNEKPNT